MHPNVYLWRRRNGIYYFWITVDGLRRWKSTGTGKKAEALRINSDYRTNMTTSDDDMKPGTLMIKVSTYCNALKK
jgi:predicted GIY-YIG superfamily endonuclease